MTVAALTTAEIEKLEQLLNHSFGDHQLLLRAITHASAVPKGPSYERLEFLGDRVLGLVLAEFSLVDCLRAVALTWIVWFDECVG